MIVCAKCGSPSQKESYDRERGFYPVCLMCGCEKLIKKETTPSMSSKPHNKHDLSSNESSSLFEVVGKLTYHGEEAMNELPKEKQELIIEAHKAGYGTRQIAGKVGVARNTVRTYIRRKQEGEGMPKQGERFMKYDDELKEKVIAEAEALGLPLEWSQYNELGRKHGMSGATIWTWIVKKHGRAQASKSYKPKVEQPKEADHQNTSTGQIAGDFNSRKHCWLTSERKPKSGIGRLRRWN